MKQLTVIIVSLILWFSGCSSKYSLVPNNNDILNQYTTYVSAWSDQECRDKNMYPVKHYNDGSVLCGTSATPPVDNLDTNQQQSSNNSVQYVSAWSDQECRDKNMYPVKHYNDGSVLCGTSATPPVDNPTPYNYSQAESQDQESSVLGQIGNGLIFFIKVLAEVGHGMAANPSNTYQSNTYQPMNIQKVDYSGYTSKPIRSSSVNNQQSNYVGSSGTKYQYDMNNQNDRLNYSTDIDAQRRDMMKLPATNVDTLKGQYGGGIY